MSQLTRATSISISRRTFLLALFLAAITVSEASFMRRKSKKNNEVQVEDYIVMQMEMAWGMKEMTRYKTHKGHWPTKSSSSSFGPDGDGEEEEEDELLAIIKARNEAREAAKKKQEEEQAEQQQRAQEQAARQQRQRQQPQPQQQHQAQQPRFHSSDDTVDDPLMGMVGEMRRTHQQQRQQKQKQHQQHQRQRQKDQSQPQLRGPFHGSDGDDDEAMQGMLGEMFHVHQQQRQQQQDKQRQPKQQQQQQQQENNPTQLRGQVPSIVDLAAEQGFHAADGDNDEAANNNNKGGILGETMDGEMKGILEAKHNAARTVEEYWDTLVAMF